MYTRNDAITHGRLLISVNANGGPALTAVAAGRGAWLSSSVGPDRRSPITPAPLDGQTPRPPTSRQRRANRFMLVPLRTALSQNDVDDGPPSPLTHSQSANAIADNKEPRARLMQGRCNRRKRIIATKEVTTSESYRLGSKQPPYITLLHYYSIFCYYNIFVLLLFILLLFAQRNNSIIII